MRTGRQDCPCLIKDGAEVEQSDRGLVKRIKNEKTNKLKGKRREDGVVGIRTAKARKEIHREVEDCRKEFVWTKKKDRNSSREKRS